jgi:hypothetical protein
MEAPGTFYIFKPAMKRHTKNSKRKLSWFFPEDFDGGAWYWENLCEI